MKYPIAEDGEWILPVMRGYRMRCCDCGLTHRLTFRVVKKGRKGKTYLGVEFMARRDNRSTAQARRNRKVK